MNVALRQPMTVEEFLAWVETQEGRWEFDGFQPVAMVGGTRAHYRISTNLVALMSERLRGTPCEAYSEGFAIRPAGSIRFPDVFVSCGPIANNATEAPNPVVVFEVLSPGTAMTDHGIKNAEYRGTPSIRRYVMLEQDRIAATVFERRIDAWVGSLITDPGAVLEMPEIGVRLPLVECYEGVIAAGERL